MSEAREKNCGNCQFSFYGRGADGKEGQGPLLCRRFPPTNLLTDISRDVETNRSTGINYWSVWAMTQLEFWCGEHKVRAELALVKPSVVPLREPKNDVADST